jgi:hypothetical protein
MTIATVAQPDSPTPAEKSWRDVYRVHPCADVFPMMNDTEIDALAADINAHGLQQCVVLWQDPKAPTKKPAYFVLDGRNRLDALARLGIEIPSPDDPREMVDLPGGQLVCVFEIANDRNHWQSPQVVDPAEFVIGANIRRRHLTKEQQAELIVKTIAAGDPNDRATVARSFSPRSGKKGGSTKDRVLAKAVSEAQKHGISKRTVQNARAKLQGKQPAPRKKIGVSATPPKSDAVPLGASRSASVSAPSADVINDMTARLNAMLPASMQPAAQAKTPAYEEPLSAPKPKVGVVTFKRKLRPIIDGLKAEGRKNMATMSPGTVAHLTFQLEQLVERLDVS